MPDIFVPKKKKDTEKKTESLSYPSHIRHLSSFNERPLGLHFINQEPDEEILLFLRPHFITNIPWVFIGIILTLIPFIFIFFPILENSFPFINSIPLEFKIAFLFFYYLVVFNYLLVNFITWYYSISLVTQKRIVDIDFSDLIYHDVAITKLSLVEDVNYTQTGFIRTLFNYGDVFVQTAGEQKHFDFLAVPNPGKAVDIIQTLIGRRK